MDPTVHAVLEALGPDQAFEIMYHMSWPNGSDPFYLFNPADNDARRYYYGINAIPALKCDGTTCGTSQYAIQSAINNRLAIPSDIWLDLDAVLNGSNLEVTCTAVSDVTITGNVVLHMALLDRYSYLNAPNGQPHYYDSLWDLAPTGSGQTFNVTAGDTTTFYAVFPLDPTWAIDSLDMACFVQDNTTHEILQARLEQVPVDFPGLYYVDYLLEDNGNNDGRAEPGETAYLYVTLGNGESFQTAVNVVGTLSTDDPDLDITTPDVNFPDIPNGQTAANSDPFVFEVSPDAEPHLTTLHLQVVADPLQTVFETDIEMFIGWPEVLLVDDDGGGIFETYYQSALDNLGKSYEYWDINLQGVPSPTTMSGYPVTIWFTGFVSVDALSVAERLLIEDYLDGGGFLFMSGQNIAQSLSSGAPDFLSDVLHAELGTMNTQWKLLDGTGPDPLWNTLSLDCNPGGSGSGSCTHPDGINVLPPAEEVFIYSNGAYHGGLAYEDAGGSKLVFFSFPFEAISGQNNTNTREEVLDAIFEFFGPITAVEPEAKTRLPDEFITVHPNPFNPIARIRYHLDNSTSVRLAVYDVTGSLVKTLVNGWNGAGNHEVLFDAKGLPSGIYIYRMQAGGAFSAGKILLLK